MPKTSTYIAQLTVATEENVDESMQHNLQVKILEIQPGYQIAHLTLNQPSEKLKRTQPCLEKTCLEGF